MNIPIASICDDCAQKKGADSAENNGVTMWEDNCYFCKKQTNCCSTRDYKWPNQKFIYWD